MCVDLLYEDTVRPVTHQGLVAEDPTQAQPQRYRDARRFASDRRPGMNLPEQRTGAAAIAPAVPRYSGVCPVGYTVAALSRGRKFTQDAPSLQQSTNPQPNAGRAVVHYQVSYAGEGIFPDRDAFYYRLRVYADGRYLGAWAGAVDSITLLGLPVGTDVEQLVGKAVFATAKRIRDLAEYGELRSEWQLEVDMLRLTLSDLQDVTDNHDVRWHDSEMVLEFDV
jgi:hypothetical protein